MKEDCEGEEISLEKFQQECDEDEVTENDLTAAEDNSEVVDATTVQSNNDQSNSTSFPKHHVSLILGLGVLINFVLEKKSVYFE